MRMNRALNPSNELKEKALARIPKNNRNKFYRVDSEGHSERIGSIFDLKKGDRFLYQESSFGDGIV